MKSIRIEDLSILLVEPSIAQSKIIKSALNAGGVSQVELAHSIDDALLRLQDYQPDVVISSMYFEGGTGTDLLLKIRHNPEMENLPFMLVSSETKFEYLDPIKQAGVVAILPKPFDLKDLRQALRATLDYIEEEDIELETFDIQSLRILIVDDSMLARRHINRVLTNLGARDITQAVDGADAIERLKESEFDLVVTDYNMPHVDGEQLLRYIRNESSQSYVPVLMVTSEQNEATLSSVQKSGVSGLCDKPFDTDNVKQILANLL
jgi:two-component system chemotaxis response regulator CheY